MDEVAKKSGFVVAYLNGTPVTRMLGADKLGWNAGGGCCGVPAENNVDDVGYHERHQLSGRQIRRRSCSGVWDGSFERRNDDDAAYV